MGNDTDAILVNLLKVLLELSVDLLGPRLRLFHHFDKPLLVNEEVGVDIDELLLLGLDFLFQDIVLSFAFDSGAFVGSSQVENSLSNQQLLAQSIIDPFLDYCIHTSISPWRIVF